ncbi:hypothetical protein FB451DRAFT_1248464 [Mycena latifolia]|nr:hypothetical protein FB451DRAFT_1248464 [Mycena latifolia]
MDIADSSHGLSNTPESSVESPSVLRTRLAELDAEVDALEARLHVLAEERRRVIRSLDSITYPVLTLPPEITAHIFSHYVDNPHIGRTNTPGRGPLLLASVCREWRNICLSVGSLWASLRIYPTPIDRDVEEFLSFIRCWLSRAGRQPLDLQVFGAQYTSEMFSAISHHSPQLRTLHLTLGHPFSFPNADIRGRIPSLTKLAVTILNDWDEEPVMLTAFSDAPALRDAQLSGASLRWISLPWVQLTHLELSDDSLSAYVDVLRQTPNLEILRVGITYLHRAPDPSSAPLILPNLHTLVLYDNRQSMLLPYLTLPALQTLELMSLAPENSSLLRQLARRSAWSLRSICLIDMSPEAAVLCLQSLPSLEAVEIRNNEWPNYDWDPLFELLARENAFLPALRAMTLEGFAEGRSSTSLIEMLESRWRGNRRGVSKLASFRLKLESGHDTTIYEAELRMHLRALEQEVVLS